MGSEMNDNPILLAVQRAREETEQRLILERALRDSIPEERISSDPKTAGGDKVRMRGVPITALGVAAVQPGTQPLLALLAKEARRARVRRIDAAR